MNSRHPDPRRVLGRYRVAGHDTTSGDSGGVFQFVRKPYVFTVKTSSDPPKSPPTESADEFLIVRKPYIFTVNTVLFEISERFLLRTGVPEFLKVYFLIFPTFYSAHRCVRIIGSACFEISDVLFCAQESQNY